MPEIPEPEVRVTRYEVSCLPRDDRNARYFKVTVEWRGSDRWAVMDGPEAYAADGTKDYEPSPSNREDDWLALYRFDLDTALALAKEVAPLMTCNGHTVADALRDQEARDA
jgi:hypothetical protein